jgi:hypothetical protein
MPDTPEQREMNWRIMANRLQAEEERLVRIEKRLDELEELCSQLRFSHLRLKSSD